MSIGYEADFEESESEEPPPKRSKRSPVQVRASDADISESDDLQIEFTSDNTSDNFDSEGSIDISFFDDSDSNDSDYIQWPIIFKVIYTSSVISSLFKDIYIILFSKKAIHT